MAQNFPPCDRDQEFLLPPSPREWLPDDHLAWFVTDDVAFRVIAAGQAPDHATIARFRRRHQDALCGLFSDVLALCAKAGLVRSGTLALDSTKLHANASDRANLTYDEIAREILDEAAATDQAEDEAYGERRGDELPEGLRTWRERRDWLRRAKRELEAEQAARPHSGNSREERLAEAERRLSEQHALERQAVEAEQAATAKRLAEHRVCRVRPRHGRSRRRGAEAGVETGPDVLTLKHLSRRALTSTSTARRPACGRVPDER